MKPWKPRRSKCGHIAWSSPTLRQHLHVALEQGHSLPEIAVMWGIGIDSMHSAMRRHDLLTLPADRLTMAEAAATLGLARDGLYSYFERRGMPLGYWGRWRTITLEQMDTLTARHALTRERPEGYVTVLELARLWSMSNWMVRTRLKGLPRLAFTGAAGEGGLEYLYSVRDVSAHAPSVGPKVCPAGCLTHADVATMLNVNVTAVKAWRASGCPVIKGRGELYYRPEALMAWLADRPAPHMRGYAKTIRAALQQQRAA